MKNNLAIILVLSLLMALVSCRGDQQNRLIGAWEQIPETEPDSTFSIIWQFYAGDAVVIYTNSGEKKDSLQYTYDISGSTFYLRSGVDDPEYIADIRDPRGQYWVDELSNEQFKITKRSHPDGTTDAVYLRLELIKR